MHRSLNSTCRLQPRNQLRQDCPGDYLDIDMSGQGPSDPLKSSQDFVRALKAASDPPVVAGGLTKFEIAEAAWNNANFYVPSKAELIADWLFTKLLKERGKEL
jgi:hypothetical protein